MNEYNTFHNGFSWTCEVVDDNGQVICHSTGNSPVEAIKKAIENEKNPDSYSAIEER